MHVCGLESSKLRKWVPPDPRADYPTHYTYCSWDPITSYTSNGGFKHKFPILTMENTNQHCAVESKYWPYSSSTCTGGVKDVNNYNQIVLKEENPTKGAFLDTESIPYV